MNSSLLSRIRVQCPHYLRILESTFVPRAKSYNGVVFVLDNRISRSDESFVLRSDAVFDFSSLEELEFSFKPDPHFHANTLPKSLLEEPWLTFHLSEVFDEPDGPPIGLGGSIGIVGGAHRLPVKGSDLLNAALKIRAALGASVVGVRDTSHLPLPGCADTNLRLLMVAAQGRSWQERQGFLPLSLLDRRSDSHAVNPYFPEGVRARLAFEEFIGMTFDSENSLEEELKRRGWFEDDLNGHALDRIKNSKNLTEFENLGLCSNNTFTRGICFKSWARAVLNDSKQESPSDSLPMVATHVSAILEAIEDEAHRSVVRSSGGDQERLEQLLGHSARHECVYVGDGEISPDQCEMIRNSSWGDSTLSRINSLRSCLQKSDGWRRSEVF